MIPYSCFKKFVSESLPDSDYLRTKKATFRKTPLKIYFIKVVHSFSPRGNNDHNKTLFLNLDRD
jgi:hypothetical protein